MPGIKTILCVEDDRFIGEMYVRSLQREGYKVDWLVNGVDAVEAAIKNQYDLILLDIMLPERQGNDLLKDLRGTTDKVPKSRILVLTNYDQDEESRRAMQSKADGYLIKADITPRHLIRIIDKMVPVE